MNRCQINAFIPTPQVAPPAVSRTTVETVVPHRKALQSIGYRRTRASGTDRPRCAARAKPIDSIAVCREVWSAVEAPRLDPRTVR